MRLFSSPHSTRCLQTYCMAWVIFVAFSSSPLVETEARERPMEHPTLSHDTNQWDFHLAQRGRPKRRAGISPPARISLLVADVRASIRPAFRSLSPRRA